MELLYWVSHQQPLIEQLLKEQKKWKILVEKKSEKKGAKKQNKY